MEFVFSSIYLWRCSPRTELIKLVSFEALSALCVVILWDMPLTPGD